MKHMENVGIVRAYLEEYFPEYEVGDSDDKIRHSRSFRLSRENTAFLLTVPNEILGDCSNSEIGTLLRESRLADFLQGSSGARVVLAKTGPRIET